MNIDQHFADLHIYTLNESRGKPMYTINDFFIKYFNDRSDARLFEDSGLTTAIVYTKDESQLRADIVRSFRNESRLFESNNRTLVFETIHVDSGIQVRW